MLAQEEAGARDFRRNLTRHLVAAEHGSKGTIVTRNGRPVCALVPIGDVERLVELERVASDAARHAQFSDQVQLRDS